MESVPEKDDALFKEGTVEEGDIVAECLYALSGEQNRLMSLSGDGSRFVLTQVRFMLCPKTTLVSLKVADEVLSVSQHFAVRSVAAVASHVYFVEKESARFKSGEPNSADSIKHAFYSSVFTCYKQYFEEVELLTRKVGRHIASFACATSPKLHCFSTVPGLKSCR